MRLQKISSFLFVLVVTIACKKNDAGEDNYPNPDPIKTEKGVALGVPATAVIGPAGGELTSSDGKVKMIVAAGTVAATTEFSIQPITNTLLMGNNRTAYRLLPEGSNFSKPVQLQFRYTVEDTLHTTEDLLTVASQRSDGAWSVLPARLDKSAKMLTVETTHFSDWTITGGLYVWAENEEIGLGEKTTLRVVSVWGDNVLTPLVPTLNSDDKNKVESINNWRIASGIGGLSVETGQQRKLQTKAEYGAPSDIDQGRDTMTITVDVKGYNLIKDPAAPGGVRRLNKLILFERIVVVKEFIKAVIGGTTYMFMGTDAVAATSNGALLIGGRNAGLDLNISILGDSVGLYNCDLHTGIQAFVTQGPQVLSTAFMKCSGSGAVYSGAPIELKKAGGAGQWVEGKFSGSLFDNQANACAGPVPTVVTEIEFNLIRRN